MCKLKISDVNFQYKKVFLNQARSLVSVDSGDKNPETVTEGSIVTVVDNQLKVADVKSMLLEATVVEEVVIIKTNESKLKVKLTDADKLEVNPPENQDLINL